MHGPHAKEPVPLGTAAEHAVLAKKPAPDSRELGVAASGTPPRSRASLPGKRSAGILGRITVTMAKTATATANSPAAPSPEGREQGRCVRKAGGRSRPPPTSPRSPSPFCTLRVAAQIRAARSEGSTSIGVSVCREIRPRTSNMGG